MRVKVVLSRHNHMWMTRPSTWIIRINYTMSHMMVMMPDSLAMWLRVTMFSRARMQCLSQMRITLRLRTILEQLSDVPPYPRGHEDLSLLSFYASYVALSLWYNANNVSVNFIFFCMQNLKNNINTWSCLLILFVFNYCLRHFLYKKYKKNKFLYVKLKKKNDMAMCHCLLILFVFNYCSCNFLNMKYI